jgi:hypothetical protein
MVEDRKSTAKEELKWRAEFKTLGREAVHTTGSITMLVLNPQPAMACPATTGASVDRQSPHIAASAYA